MHSKVTVYVILSIMTLACSQSSETDTYLDERGQPLPKGCTHSAITLYSAAERIGLTKRNEWGTIHSVPETRTRNITYESWMETFYLGYDNPAPQSGMLFGKQMPHGYQIEKFVSLNHWCYKHTDKSIVFTAKKPSYSTGTAGYWSDYYASDPIQEYDTLIAIYYDWGI